MQWAEMVVAIVLIVTIGRIVQGRYPRTTRLRLRGLEAGSDEENERLRGEVRELKERIAVLERLATDDNSNSARLDREIERLRDRS